MTQSPPADQDLDARHEPAASRGAFEPAGPTPKRRRPPVDASRHFLDLAHARDLPRFDWQALFGNPNPVEFEIGSGKGLFLANAAESRPDRNFLGVEISRKYAELAAARLAKRALVNARVAHGDARTLIEHAAPDQGLAAIHVYFPDPWWKTRHRKRRIVDDWLLDQVERALAPGGELFFATDVAAYFASIERLMAARTRFERAPWRPAVNPEQLTDGLTNFERKYRAQGRSIDLARYVFAGQGLGVDETSS